MTEQHPSKTRVERLRHEADEAFEAGYQQHEDSLREAADEIERLTRERDELERENEQLCSDGAGISESHTRAVLERDALRAENERVRRAFQTLLNEMSDPVGSLGLDYEVRQITNGTVDDARAELEAK